MPGRSTEFRARKRHFRLSQTAGCPSSRRRPSCHRCDRGFGRQAILPLEGPVGEVFPRVCVMRNFYALARPHAVNGMYTGNISPAYGLDAYFPFRPFTDQTFPAEAGTLLHVPSSGVSKGFGEPQSRAAGSILLHVVMHFQNIHIIGFAKHADQLRKQIEQDVDAHAQLGERNTGVRSASVSSSFFPLRSVR